MHYKYQNNLLLYNFLNIFFNTELLNGMNKDEFKMIYITDYLIGK